MTIDLGSLLAAIIACVGTIVWFVRLEGSVKAVDKRVDVVEKRIDATDKRLGVAEVQINDMNSNVVKELAKLREEFAELKGWLKAIKIQKED